MKISPLNTVFTLALSLLGIILFSCDKQSNTNFTVEGKLENLVAPNIYAIKEITQDSLVIDTIEVKQGGEFIYKGKVDYPTLLTLSLGKENKPLTLFLEPEYQVKIKGDITQTDLIEIKGGAVNNDLQNFKDKNNTLFQSKYRILSKNENLDPAELRNVNLQLARNAREYAEQHPAKIASVILLNEYSVNNTPLDQLGKDINALKGPAAGFYLTSALKEYYDKEKTSAVGAKAPSITLKNTKGKSISLDDFKGKSVLLIFDIKDAPLNTSYFDKLKETQKKLKNKVSFISIVIDENNTNPDPKTLEIANALDWTVLFDGKKWSSKEVKKYNVKTVPYMILISPEGNIQERDVALDSLIVQFDKEKTK